MLLAYAQAEHDVASDEVEDHENEHHFENDFASMLMGHHEEVDSGEENKFEDDSEQQRHAYAQALSQARGGSGAN